MQPIEIITIIACVLIVGGVLGTYIYKKITHKPTGCCSGGCDGNCASCQEFKALAEAKKKQQQKDAELVEDANEELDVNKSDDAISEDTTDQA